jgi:hypothetical protein
MGPIGEFSDHMEIACDMIEPAAGGSCNDDFRETFAQKPSDGFFEICAVLLSDAPEGNGPESSQGFWSNRIEVSNNEVGQKAGTGSGIRATIRAHHDLSLCVQPHQQWLGRRPAIGKNERGAPSPGPLHFGTNLLEESWFRHAFHVTNGP